MKKSIVFLSLFSILSLNAMDAGEKVDHLARFLVSMTRYIQWPGNMKTGNFKIGVVGDFNLYKKLCEETMGTGIQQRNVDVVNLFKIENANIADFHILILSEALSTRENIAKAKTQIGSKATLLVTEGSNALNYGSGVNFIEVNNKIGFELKKQNISKQGIHISSQIESFAVRVVD